MAPLLRGDGKGLVFTWSLDSAQLLGWNMAGMAATIAWTGATTGLVFWGLDNYNMLRWLLLLLLLLLSLLLVRVEMEHEFKGMDLVHHGESAYPADAWVEQQYMDAEEVTLLFFLKYRCNIFLPCRRGRRPGAPPLPPPPAGRGGGRGGAGRGCPPT